jgi:hypothetical protein
MKISQPCEGLIGIPSPLISIDPAIALFKRKASLNLRKALMGRGRVRIAPMEKRFIRALRVHQRPIISSHCKEFSLSRI